MSPGVCLLAAVTGLYLTAAIWQPGLLVTGLVRLAWPLGDYPPVGWQRFVVQVEPGEVVWGGDAVVTVRLIEEAGGAGGDGGSNQAAKGVVLVQQLPEGGGSWRLAMQQENGVFSRRLLSLREPVRFYVATPDGRRSRWMTIRPLPMERVAGPMAGDDQQAQLSADPPPSLGEMISELDRLEQLAHQIQQQAEQAMGQAEQAGQQADPRDAAHQAPGVADPQALALLSQQVGEFTQQVQRLQAKLAGQAAAIQRLDELQLPRQAQQMAASSQAMGLDPRQTRQAAQADRSRLIAKRVRMSQQAGVLLPGRRSELDRPPPGQRQDAAPVPGVRSRQQTTHPPHPPHPPHPQAEQAEAIDQAIPPRYRAAVRDYLQRIATTRNQEPEP